MTRLLIDPLVLTPPVSDEPRSQPSLAYFTRLIDWATDTRVHVGTESHQLVYERFAEFGFPDRDVSFDVPHFRREFQTALSQILSRVLQQDATPGERVFSPAYLGRADENLVLQFDISGILAADITGIATVAEHWAEEAVDVLIEPGPPAQLALCCFPHGQVPAERERRVREALAGLKLHIVGGQSNQAVITRLSDELGLRYGDITWLSCERAKPPRHLDSRWANLSPRRDLTVCITGRVGHSTSEKAKACAAKRGVAHIQVESANQILDSVADYALRGSRH